MNGNGQRDGGRLRAGWMASWLAALALAGASPAAAQEPLDHIPDNALMVFRVASVEEATGQANDFVAALGQNNEEAVAAVTLAIAECFELEDDNRVNAFDLNSPMYAFFLPRKEGRAPIAFLVKAKDQEQLERGIVGAVADELLKRTKREDGFTKVQSEFRAAWFAKRGEWLLYTLDEDIADRLGKPAESSFAKTLNKRGKAMLVGGGVSMWVNVAGFFELLGAEIDQGRDLLIEAIKNMPDEQLANSGADPKAIKALYVQLVEGLFAAGRDVTWTAGNISANKDGVQLVGDTEVKTDSATDKFLARNPAGDLALVGKLPAAGHMVFGMHSDSSVWVDVSQKYLRAMVEGNPELAKQFDRGLEMWRKAKVGDAAVSMLAPTAAKSGMIVYMLTQAENPQAMREGYKDFVQPKEIDLKLYKQKSEYEPNAEKIGDTPIDLLRNKYTWPAANDQTEQMTQQIMKRYLGGDEYQMRIAALEKLLVMAGGNRKEPMEQALKAAQGQGGLAEDPAYVAVRKRLDPRANVLFLLDLPNFTQSYLKALSDVPPFNLFLVQLDLDAKLPRSYGGVSLATRPQGLQARLYVPVAQPQAFMKLIGPLFPMGN